MTKADMSNRSVWSTRHTFHNGNNASQPSKGVDDSEVQVLLAEIRALRTTTEKAAAVRPNESNIAGVEILSNCDKNISNATQPFRSPPQPTSQAAVEEVNEPSLAHR